MHISKPANAAPGVRFAALFMPYAVAILLGLSAQVLSLGVLDVIFIGNLACQGICFQPIIEHWKGVSDLTITLAKVFMQDIPFRALLLTFTPDRVCYSDQRQRRLWASHGWSKPRAVKTLITKSMLILIWSPT